MKILVRREYHGQIWFEAEDVDAKWKTSKSFQWHSRRDTVCDVSEAPNSTDTQGDRSINDSTLQGN